MASEQLSESAKAVEHAYLQDLAWQSRRERKLNDLRERDHDRLQASLELLRRIVSASSQRLLEQELWETAEELEKRDKRRKRHTHPGGFDSRKRFKR